MDFATTDLDSIRESVTRVFKPHRIDLVGRTKRIEAHNHYGEIGSLALVQLRYGALVDIEPGPMEPYALVQVPLSGASEISCGRQAIVSTPLLASVVSPHLHTRLNYSPDCEQLILRLSRESLTRHCARLLGRDLRNPLEFDLGFRLDGETGQSWLRLMRFLQHEMEQAYSLLRAPLAATQFEQMLMTTLLMGHAHNYAEALHQPQSAVAPFYVKRAEAHIEEHADEPISMAELAAEAGVSARSLHEGFQRYRNTTPMNYLKAVRLQRAYDHLLSADPTRESVTDVAMQWGFMHLGHFAAAYKERFGETPSQTLRRWR